MNGLRCTKPEAGFEEQLEEVAVGHLPEPDRGLVLAHVATCPSCRARLDDLLALTDDLLLLAPQHEPPPGFETRVLERLAPLASSAPRTTPRARWTRGLAAPVALVIGALGALGAVAVLRDDEPSVTASGAVVRTGVIRDRDGQRTGSVQLLDAPQPYALVTIDQPRPRPGEVRCELELGDGTSVHIGSWGYDDVVGKVWAAGIPAELLDAVAMRVLTDDGTVVATAALD